MSHARYVCSTPRSQGQVIDVSVNLNRDKTDHNRYSKSWYTGMTDWQTDTLTRCDKALFLTMYVDVSEFLFAAPITSDLDLKPSLLSNRDSVSYDPLSASSKQYMSLLRKNYFV